MNSKAGIQQRFSRLIFGGVSAIAGPLLAVRAKFSRKWSSTYDERNGRGRWNELVPIRLSKCSPAERTTAADNCRGVRIWLHGASVGEIQGVAPISQRLSAEYPGIEQVITCTSTAGRDEVLRRGLTTRAFLLPHDLTGPVNRVIDRIAPGLVVISETEIWPTLLLSLAARGIPVMIVNGRISDRTINRYLKLRPFLKPVLAGVERFLVQTELDAERFVKIGAAESKVVVTGSSKYDAEINPLNLVERARLNLELGLEPNDPVFVAGSVRPGEDEDVIAAYLEARKSVSGLQLVIAPRHADRFEAVGGLLTKNGIQFNRRSSGPAESKRPVVLLDTIGELGRIYGLSTIAFVGGTLVNVGGHNPFEPAAYGIAVLIGPHVQNVRDAAGALRREGGAVEVKDRTELAAALTRLLTDRTELARSGAAAKRVWARNLGATARIVDHLRSRLDQLSQPAQSQPAQSRAAGNGSGG